MNQAKPFRRAQALPVGNPPDGDSRINRFCLRFGRRTLDGTKQGKDGGRMSIRRPLLWREIAILLGAKLLALTCLYFLFFAPSHRPLADAAAVSARILGLSHG